ncbi:hypothetical protein A2U01_0110150, partial [Trifolium medium]|nr:hypothetical protein [Trifolium medium]
DRGRCRNGRRKGRMEQTELPPPRWRRSWLNQTGEQIDLAEAEESDTEKQAATT